MHGILTTDETVAVNKTGAEVPFHHKSQFFFVFLTFAIIQHIFSEECKFFRMQVKDKKLDLWLGQVSM